MIASRVVHRDVPRFVHGDVSRAVPKNIHSDGSTRAVHSNVPTAVHRLYTAMYSDRIVPSVVHRDVPRDVPRLYTEMYPGLSPGPAVLWARWESWDHTAVSMTTAVPVKRLSRPEWGCCCKLPLLCRSCELCRDKHYLLLQLQT